MSRVKRLSCGCGEFMIHDPYRIMNREFGNPELSTVSAGEWQPFHSIRALSVPKSMSRQPGSRSRLPWHRVARQGYDVRLGSLPFLLTS